MYVEGLVHITELGGEYFRFDESRQELRGERSGIRYAIGSRVRVQVSRVDLDGRRIDFRLVTEGEELGASRPTRDKGGARTAPGAATAAQGKRRTAPEDDAPRRSTSRETGGGRSGTGKSTQKAALLTKAQSGDKSGKGKGRSSRRS